MVQQEITTFKVTKPVPYGLPVQVLQLAGLMASTISGPLERK